jgi:hypothetical protein
VFGNRILKIISGNKREKVTGEGIKLDLHNVVRNLTFVLQPLKMG